jgi:uncharacterized protein (DUF2252 family)
VEVPTNRPPDAVPARRQTPAERAGIGKAARAKAARASTDGWKPPSDRPDPIDLLEAQAVTRVPELVPIRYGRMLASPFAFYRGAAAIMASDLATVPNAELHVQLCGDAHLSNFGGFASPERELILDINDFDETLPGPWEWDVMRLAASAEIAGRERGFKALAQRALVQAIAQEYRLAMRGFAELGDLDLWYLHLNQQEMEARWGTSVRPKVLKTLEVDFAQGYHRDNQRAFEKLTRRVDGQLRIVAHPPLIVPIEDLVTAGEQEEFEKRIRAALNGYRATLQPDRRRLLENYEYVHMARKVVGVGSVGTRTWVVLLLGRDDRDSLFLQAKEAGASVLEPYVGGTSHENPGKRVVEGQRLMQAASDIFLGWDRAPIGLDGRSHDFYIRQLWDWKISADLVSMAPSEMLLYGRMCAWTLARAHARSGDRIAIGAYLGKGDSFDKAMTEFAAGYADQNQRDYERLVDAVKDSRVKAITGV